MSKVITRFAPSNTGNLHVGSARTALYAYCYARSQSGRCILRIEDTDKERSTRESLDDILSGLDWMGLEFDGEMIFQSTRKPIYDKYIDILIQNDHAYVTETGLTFFKTQKKDIILEDMILGKIRFRGTEMKDFVIRRMDGSVLFHLAVVVDDALSGVTHIIRGNDHVSNTDKHIAIYQALGFPVPKYGHMPLILSPSGEKLSKRRTDQNVLIKDFVRRGYCKDVFINLLGTLGWSNKDNVENFDLDFMSKNFDILDCLRANPKYDYRKFDSMNSQYLKTISLEKFAELLMEYGNKFYPDKVKKILNKLKWEDFCLLYHTRSKTLEYPFTNCDYIIDDISPIAIEDYNNDLHQSFNSYIRNISNWTPMELSKKLDEFVATRNFKMKNVGKLIRGLAVGNPVSPPLHLTLWSLGKEESIRRLGKTT